MNQISRPARSDPFRPHVSAGQVFVHAGWQRAAEGMLGALRAGRPVALLGQPGSGKSLLLNEVARRLRDEGVAVRLAERGDGLALSGAEGVLLVDEAGTLDDDALRALCDGASAVGLAGLPGFVKRLEGLPCAIAAVALEPLPPGEVAAFVAARLAEAGRPADLFAPEAVEGLARHSRGLLRLVNALGRAALFLAEMESAAQVALRHVDEADAMRRGIGEDPDAPAAAMAGSAAGLAGTLPARPSGLRGGDDDFPGGAGAPLPTGPLDREIESSLAAEQAAQDRAPAAAASPEPEDAALAPVLDAAGPVGRAAIADSPRPAAPRAAPSPTVWARDVSGEAKAEAQAAPTTPAQAMKLAQNAIRAGATQPPEAAPAPGTALVVVPEPAPDTTARPMLVTRPQRRAWTGMLAAAVALLVGGAAGWTLTAQLRPMTTVRPAAEVDVARSAPAPVPAPTPVAEPAPLAEAAPPVAAPPVAEVELPAPPPATPTPPAPRAARPPVLPSAGAPIEGSATFRGPVFNETIGIGGRLSLVIRPAGPGGAVRVRFDASNGLVGAGELTGHLSADGYLTASGTLMMGRNPFECDLSGAVAGERLNGAARFVRLGVDPANKAVTQSRFTLVRS